MQNKLDMTKYSESLLTISGGLNIHDNDFLRFINFYKNKNHLITIGKKYKI